jgi:hypothetical protein
MTIRNKFVLGLVLCTGTLASQAKAQYLITVNDSNPNAVTFTGTGADATGSSTAANTYAAGLILTGFTPGSTLGFVPALPTPLSTSSLVALLDGTQDYDDAQSGSNGIEIYGSGNGSQEDFVAGSPAFGGTVTFNLNNATFPFILPVDGTVGNIYADTNGFSGPPTLIGTYVVNNTATPEPSQLALLLAGGLGLLGVMRARARGMFGSVLG